MLYEVLIAALIASTPPQEPVFEPKRPHMEELIYNTALSEGVSSEDAERLILIAKCESGLRPGAKNPNSSAKGLLQIMGSMWEPYFGLTPEQLYDPVINVQAASDILKIQGLSAWVCNDLI
jgi:hypothetical protein